MTTSNPPDIFAVVGVAGPRDPAQEGQTLDLVMSSVCYTHALIKTEDIAMPDGSFPLIDICRAREPLRVAPTGDRHHNMATPPPGSPTQVPIRTCAEHSVAHPDPDPQNKASSL